MKTFKSRRYQPTGWRLIVKPDPVIKQVGSIVIAVDEKREARAVTTGTIVELGASCWQDTKSYDKTGDWAKVGDRVVFARYAGAYLDDGSETGVVILNDEDVEAIIKEEVPNDAGS